MIKKNIINKMFCFIAGDETGDGVVAFMDERHKLMLPMVVADMERVKSLIPIAQSIATESGITIELVEFVERKHIVYIQPNPKGDQH